MTVDNEKWPKLIRVKKGGGVEIDGKDFPWYIAEDGIAIQPGSRKELTTVTITIPCDRVEVEQQN